MNAGLCFFHCFKIEILLLLFLSSREIKELTEMRSLASNSSHLNETPVKSSGVSAASSKQQFQTPVSRRQSKISLPAASLSAPQGGIDSSNISLSSPSFNESKESTPSSSCTEYVKVDQEFKDARDTIRLLSQKLSSSASSSLPAPPK
jgi:hypothetical protein